MQEGKLAPSEARLADLWQRMVTAVGIHTVNVLMERAIYQASQKHPELALIERTEQGLSFGALEEAYADRPERDVADAFNALTSELLPILARHLLTSAVPLTVEGQMQGAVVVWRDITYIKEMERMRAEFLSMVSHQLRSPLTSVLGYAQLIQRQMARGSPPKDLESRLQVIAEQTKRVNALVEDLLEASKAEAGRLALKRKEIDLAGLIRKAVESSATLAPEHRFKVEIPEQVPPLQADPGRIAQVLRNLLSNAVKFSLPGTEVTVGLQVEPGQVVVSVADQGRGIPREDLATLFVPFHRVRQAGGREVKELGLGLFISRSIVEAHGGDMWVHSELGKGSTFYFSLPLS